MSIAMKRALLFISPMSDTTSSPLDPYELLMNLQTVAVRTMTKNNGLSADALIVDLILAMEDEYRRWNPATKTATEL